MYAYNERYTALSHDGSSTARDIVEETMGTTYPARGLRTLLGLMWTMRKKLLFMGGEFGQTESGITTPAAVGIVDDPDQRQC